MGQLELFRFIRSPERSQPGKFDVAYGLRLEPGQNILAVLDPYGLHTPETIIEISRHLQADSGTTLQELAYALAIILRIMSGQLVGDERTSTAQAVAASPAIAAVAGQPLQSMIDDLDAWLITNQDAPKPAELLDLLASFIQRIKPSATIPQNLRDAALFVVADPAWLLDRVRLGVAFSIYLYCRNSADAIRVRGRLSRLLVVASMLETIAGLPKPPAKAREIFDLLHRRPFVVGSGLLNVLKRANNLARKPGVADLYVVHQAWAKYVLGELASVEPIMARELKERLFERTDELETAVTSTTSKSSQLERDNQTSERFELSKMIAESVRQSAGVEGWLNVDTQAPSTKVGAHIGADYSYSSESQSETASRSASEIVERVVSKVEESLTVTREQRRTEKIVDRATHTFDNRQSGSPINGVYRWVDKVNRIDLVKYPNRYVFEVQIPEPAAWVRWLFDREQRARGEITDPGPFPNSFLPDDISTNPAAATYYLALGAQFGVDSLPTPPTTIAFADQIAGPPATQGNELPEFGLEHLVKTSVPDGYAAVRWNATALATSADYRDNQRHPRLYMAVGAGPYGRTVSQDHIRLAEQFSGSVGDLNRGTIPIAVWYFDIFKFVINVEIECDPTPTLITQWQMQVWAALRAAHEERRARFAEQQATADVLRTTLPVTRPPARNREMMLTELKRLSIELLSDNRLRGLGGMEYPNPTDAPIMNRTTARDSATEIQFVEQAFEWSNLSYLFYPTYWTYDGRWPGLFALEDNDPEFAAFLRAGSARVIVPVRPGYEYQAQLFVDYGLLWGGGSAPGPEDPEYLSLATEIEELQKGAKDGTVVRSWTVKIPTHMVALDATGSFPMENPDVSLP